MNYLLIISLFLSTALSAQTLRFNGEVLSAVQTADGQYLALSTPDSIFLVNNKSLQIEKRTRHQLVNPVLRQFYPGNNSLLLLNEQRKPVQDLFNNNIRPFLTRESFREFPQDSLVIFSLENPAASRKFSGSVYVATGSTNNQLAVVENNSLEITNGTNANKITLAQACRGIKASPDFKKALLTGYGQGNYSYTLLDLATGKIIYEQKQLTSPPSDYGFAGSGQLVAVALSTGIRIIDTQTGSVVSDVSLPDKTVRSLTNLSFTPDNKLVFVTDEREWHCWELDKQQYTQKIHPGLTGLFDFYDVFLNGTQLIAGGRMRDDNGLAGSYQLEKINLQDLTVFSIIEKGTVESYADSTGYTMMLNNVYTSNETAVVTFSPAREIFTLVRGNVLQVWDVKQRRKLMQHAFRAKITSTPDRSGQSILVIEARGQSSYDGYVRHIVSLKNSTIKSSEVLGEKGTGPRAMSSRFRVIADPDHNDQWLSIDGSDKIWQTAASTFSDKIIREWKGAELLQLEAMSNQPWSALATVNGITAIWQLTDQPKQITTCSDTEQFMMSREGLWRWSPEGNQLTQYKNGQAQSPVQLPGKIKRVEWLAKTNTLHAVCQPASSRTIFSTIQNNQVSKTDSIDRLYADLYALRENEWLYQDGDEGLITVFHKSAYQVPWGPRTPKAFLAGFDVSADGRLVAFSNLLLNLTTLDNKTLPSHTSYSILPDGSGRIELDTRVYQSYGSSSKKGYGLMRINDRTQDTIYSKTFIPAADDASAGVPAFEFFHNKVAVSPDGKWAISYTEGLSFYDEKKMSPALVWDLRQMKARTLNIKKVYDVRFIPGTQQVALYAGNTRGAGLNTLNYIADMPAAKLTDSTFWQDYVHYPESGLSINFRNIEWQTATGKEKKVHRSFYSRDYLTSVAYYKPAARIVAGSQNGQLLIWDTTGSSPRHILNTQGGAIEKLVVRGNRLYSLSANGDVTIVDMQLETIQVTIKFLEKEKEWRYAMLTPSGHYRIDPDLLNDFHFIKNETVYPLSSFELQGNRPDKVFKALGYADTAFLRTLELAWRSRIQRLGFDPDKLNNAGNRPVLKWDRDHLPLTATDRILQLQLTLEDQQQALKSLLIRVNGVPEFAATGMPVNGRVKKYALDYPLSLNAGRNLISITGVNEAGEESLEQTYTVYYQPDKPDTPKVFYIGIGVAEYADRQKNLRYAAKDVRDIAERLKQTKNATILDTLLNEKATLAAIQQVKQKLRQTNTDDIVVISLSGHGMISRDSGFVFAPHDMDFSRPEAKGLSIRMIESLLDGIPARKRLLLLDACHSGEDIATHSGQLPQGVSVIKRGVIVEDTDSSASGRGRNQQLLIQELFGDLSRGNGSFVISAAAGNEYAYEGQSWNNGVFTYSFLNNLSWGDRRTPLRQLRAAIYDLVNKQTNGLQTPASRRENGWWNWEF
ncbi:caspase family protein [Terrimonas ferruginea]|uniref:caspase family protein n=1 Tax=Terrimonas ferruginea TaxID=249 RepID=UPI000429438F|nr:caspase family protein [Terrimonas ferruginea]